METINRLSIVLVVCALGMLSVPLRAQTCDAPPLFDMSGPVCSASRQGMECTCSECIEWDPAAGAKFYQVRRCDDSGNNCTTVGTTRWRSHPAYTYPSGVVVPEVRPTLWCVAWDDPFPLAGASYTYSVRACAPGSSGPVCSAEYSNSVAYVAAPYMCIENGVEVPCITTISASFAFGIDLNGESIGGTAALED